MKFKMVFTASAIFCAFMSCNFAKADTQAFQAKLQKVNVQSSSSVAAQANRYNSSFYSEFASNPLLNSTVGAYGNMIQGMTGASYNMQEQVKQQMDYTRQQINENPDEDSEE